MKMSHKNQDRAEMQWIQMDMLNMEFEENTFDVCIDKATMDVLQCDNEDAWSPSIEVRERVSLFYGNCYRVLKPNGKIIQISFDQPHFRKIYINEFNRFSVTVRTINSGSLPYFIYVLDKKENC
jgi:EEF1A lysine methyltransferase 4